ncbi:MAG: hypothetical protein K2W92_01945 [Alphaproteobacteria bacterium]|jgi:hypothetical protein|nr:hypothetical protein [Alphaproteobacteria bacterium]
MSKEKKVFIYIRSTLSIVLLLFSGVSASTMEENRGEFQPKRQLSFANEQKIQDERLEQLFNDNREAMEQAKKRAKKRLRIEVPQKPYNKK